MKTTTKKKAPVKKKVASKKKAPVKKAPKVEPITFTAEEKTEVLRAAVRTWDYIASDVESVCIEGGDHLTIDIAIEQVLDASRIITIGKLSPELTVKYNADRSGAFETLLKKDRDRWY